MSREEIRLNETELASILPRARNGQIPFTQRVLPQRQLDQWPSPTIFHKLLGFCRNYHGIRFQESRIAVAGTVALRVSYEGTHGVAAAFIDDHEFCHIHPLPEGSLHLTLPDALAHRAIELGWAEPHLLALSGVMPKTLLMVYAPRSNEELETVWRLILASMDFAMGGYTK